MEKNAKELDQAIEYDRDLGYDYFGAFADTCVFLFIFRMIFLLQPLGTWTLFLLIQNSKDLVFLRFQDP